MYLIIYLQLQPRKRLLGEKTLSSVVFDEWDNWSCLKPFKIKVNASLSNKVIPAVWISSHLQGGEKKRDDPCGVLREKKDDITILTAAL